MASMLLLLRRRFSSTLAVFLVLAALPATARAEDGYQLWLRYAPVESAPLRDAYRQAIAGLVVQQTPATGAIVTREVTRALKGLIGIDVPVWTNVTGDGALVIGTASSPIVSALGWGDVLKGLGPEGYVDPRRRGSAAGAPSSSPRSATVGALYGTFHLLRLLQTATPIQRLDVARAAAPPAAHARITGTTSTARSSAATPADRSGSGTSCRRRSIRATPTTPARTRRSASTARCINNVNANAEVADRRVHRQGRGARGRVPALRHARLSLGQLRRAAACSVSLPTADPLDAGGRRVVEGEGGRDLPGDPRLRRLPRQGQQRGAAGPAGLQAARTPTAPTCSPTRSRRTAAS